MLIAPSNVFSPDFFQKKTWLLAILDAKVINWLDEDVKDLLLDYIAIRKGYENYAIGGLKDYSYLITPAFKALEGTLIQIAKRLGFNLEKYNFQIGVVFSEENLEKFYNEVLNKIDKLAEEQKLDIQQWLNNARRLLRHLRHSPAHFGGEKKENHNKAFLTGDQILFTINEMCLSLITSGVFDRDNEKEEKSEARKIIASA